MTSDPGDSLLLLHAYFDGELDAAAALEMERRLASDPVLAGEHARLIALRQAIRQLPRVTAPQRLRDAVIGVADRQPPARTLNLWASSTNRARLGARLAMAATLALGLGLGSSITYVMVAHGDRQMSTTYAALDAAVAGHVRALAVGTPFDVASSDRHTVKPWFAGRLTFAPQVIDLAENGFALAGGRVNVIAGRTAATLVYRHDKHILSLTAAQDPDGAFKDSVRTTRNGFATVHWWERGTAFWAVSDAAPEELDAFASAFRQKAMLENK